MARLKYLCPAFEGLGVHQAYALSRTIGELLEGRKRIEILRNCRRAIPDRGVYLIIVIRPGDARHHDEMMDMPMLAVTGGRERTAKACESLLAVSNLRLARIPPTRMHQSLVVSLLRYPECAGINAAAGRSLCATRITQPKEKRSFQLRDASRRSLLKADCWYPGRECPAKGRVNGGPHAHPAGF